MANVDPIFVETPKTVAATITAADTTTKKTIYTAGTSGGSVMSLGAVNTDTTSDALIDLFINDGSTSTQIGAVIAPAKAGTDGVVPVANLLSPALLAALLNDGSLAVNANYSIQVAANATVSADLAIVGIAGDY